MKYILRGKNDLENPIPIVLENRKISEDLFKVTKLVIEDYEDYDHMNEGVELFLKHINNNSKIAMVIDPDFDGFASYCIIYRGIKHINPDIKIETLIHTEKQHGLSEDIIIPDDIDLVIMTDSSSNDFKQHKDLKDKGVDILILDHHHCDEGYSPYAIVINNQLSKSVKNKNSCGAFVCYKFLKAVDDYNFNDIADNFKDLVAFANVADVMDLREGETRYFVYDGINNINTTFIKALIEDNSYELEGKININKIGWTISPKINGVVRSGTMEEKLKMAQAFISDDYDFCLEVAKMCKSIKTRQDNAVKSSLKKIEKNIDIKQTDRCIIEEVGKTLNKTHTGLVAGKLSDKYKLPTLLYRDVKDKKGFVGGSFRGIEEISNDLRLDILKSDLVTMSQGHNSAGGFELNKDNVPLLKEYLNNLYKDKEVSYEKTYYIDFIMEDDEINKNTINELAKYEDEWGNHLDDPLILFKNFTICIEDENIKRPNMIFDINGVKFIKKFLTNDFKNLVLNKGFLFVNIVGKVSNNLYNGRKTPQIEVVDIEIN